MIRALMHKDPCQRLGGDDRDGCATVRAHVFFATVDWDAALRRALEPPFVPRLNGPDDARFFDTTLTRARADLDDSSATPGFRVDLPDFAYQRRSD